MALLTGTHQCCKPILQWERTTALSDEGQELLLTYETARTLQTLRAPFGDSTFHGRAPDELQISFVTISRILLDTQSNMYVLC